MKLNKVIILAGGKGLRIYSEKNSLTKPLARINGKPLIWYVINTYLKNGLNSFIICAGANTEAINSLFEKSNILFKGMKKNKLEKNHYSFEDKENKKWDLRIVNTGVNTIPHIYVDRIDSDGSLILKHEHDGRDLDLDYADSVVKSIRNLWKEGDVKLFTIIENEVWEI